MRTLSLLILAFTLLQWGCPPKKPDPANALSNNVANLHVALAAVAPRERQARALVGPRAPSQGHVEARAA